MKLRELYQILEKYMQYAKPECFEVTIESESLIIERVERLVLDEIKVNDL